MAGYQGKANGVLLGPDILKWTGAAVPEGLTLARLLGACANVTY